MRHVLATTAALVALLGLGNVQTRAWGCELSDAVQSWYQRYLGRPADPCGLNNWVGQLHCGKSGEFVQAGILGSDEYFCRHGQSAEGFVAGLYFDVLGRAPYSHEVHSWVCRLQRHGCRQQLAQEFVCAAQPELVRRVVPVEAPLYVPAPVLVPAPVPQGVTGIGSFYRAYPPRSGIRVQIGYSSR